MPKQKDEDLQKKYVELQIIVQQINQLQQQLMNVQNQILELNSLKESLNNLKDIKSNTDSFSPVGFNIFVRTKLQETNELLVNVGSNVFVTKTVEETNSLINLQIEQITSVIKEIEARLNELEQAGALVQNEILKEGNK